MIKYLNQFLSLALALMCIALIGCSKEDALQPVSWVGYYTSERPNGLTEVDSTGVTTIEAFPSTAEHLVFMQDGRAHYYAEGSNGSPDLYIDGVWGIKDGHLFCYLSYELDETDFAHVYDRHVEGIGVFKAVVTKGQIQFQYNVGGMIIVREKDKVFRRVAPYEVDWTIQMDEVQEHLDQLNHLISEIPPVATAKKQSKSAFFDALSQAIKNRDAKALLRLSYIHKEPLEALSYHRYFSYLEQLSEEGDLEIEEGSQSLREGHSYPANIEFKGSFNLMRQIGDGARSGTTYWYGTVNGKWFLIGSPTRTSKHK